MTAPRVTRYVLPVRVVDACRAMTRQHSSTFYLGSLLLDPPRRAAVWAVYAVCRLGDDLVDNPEPLSLEERRKWLETWWQKVQASYAGRPPGEPVWEALAWTVTTYPVPLHAFHELYQGFLTDISGGGIVSMDDLELYCRRVAGVIGLMIAPICGYEGGKQTLERALRLGQAMQLTNILRDVGEDLKLGRVYLPADLLARYDLDRDFLAGGRVTPQYRALMACLAARARAWYAEADEGLLRLHPRARLAVAVAARSYERILDALESNGYDNFSRRAFVTNRQKLALVPSAVWRYVVVGSRVPYRARTPAPESHP